MKNKIAAIKTIKPKTILWLALLACQVLLLCWMTLRGGSFVLDNDAGKVYSHMLRMVRSGTVLVPGWEYITTMELDCAVLLALPIYAATGNTILSFVLADFVIIALWVWLVFALFRRMELGVPYACAGCVLVMLPYALSTLSYWNMMFLNAAQYTFKVMLPVLLVFLLLQKQKPRVGHWVLLGVYLAGCLLTAFSSGAYVALCGLVPVTLLFAWQALCAGRKPTLYQAIALGGGLLVSAGGMWLNVACHINALGNSMELNTLETFFDNLNGLVLGMFRLFGAMGENMDAAEVLSPAGISILLRCGLLFMLLVAAVIGLRFMLRSKEEEAKPLLPAGAAYLISVFWWNLCVMLLTNSAGPNGRASRYQLIGFVPLILAMLVLLHQWIAAQPRRVQLAACTAAPLLLVALMLAANRDAYHAIWKPDGSIGTNNTQRVICGTIQEQVPTAERVLMVNDSDISEICDALDAYRDYYLYTTGDDFEIVCTRDGSWFDCDAANFINQPTAVLVWKGDDITQVLPDYLASRLEYVASADKVDIYMASGDGDIPVDGGTGLPYGGTAVDYCNSRWYKYTGTIDTSNRHLLTDAAGGVVMASSRLEFAVATKATVQCHITSGESAGQVGKLQLWRGEEMVVEAPVNAEADAIVLEGMPAGDTWQLKLELDAGVTADVGSILFEEMK